ncbi:MAG: DUF1611 domain-containing protein [Myxococcota bacterium]
MNETAVVLANEFFDTPHAKTSHGLVRGPCRFQLLGVVDSHCAGRDAGEVLDGEHRGVPVFASMADVLAQHKPTYVIVGVATPGGVLPGPIRSDLIAAARAGVGLINGLHTLLSDDPEIAAAAEAGRAPILDIRKPRPVAELAHWHGDILEVKTPRVAVLGTDCAIGKRTTATFLLQAARKAGIAAEMISTGQTGWLQGHRYGFFFDATPNDFVSGELERLVVRCVREADPALILFEGQGGFFNPSGPCGAEFIVSGGAKTVVIQHAPKRPYHDDLEHLHARIAPLEKHIAMAELLGARVAAVTLNQQAMSEEEAVAERDRLRAELGRPVVLPLIDGVNEVLAAIRAEVGL